MLVGSGAIGLAVVGLDAALHEVLRQMGVLAEEKARVRA